MTWFCLGLMGISGLIAASLFFPDSLTEKWPFHKQFLLGLGICSYVVSILVFGADMLLKVRRRINRDRRAYLEIVDMLRELRGLFERKSLSTRLESAEFLIRLARLDIGPGTTFSNMLFGVRLRESKYPSSSEAMKSMSEAYAIEAIELEKLNAQIREESSTPVKNNPVVVTKHKNNP